MKAAVAATLVALMLGACGSVAVPLAAPEQQAAGMAVPRVAAKAEAEAPPARARKEPAPMATSVPEKAAAIEPAEKPALPLSARVTPRCSVPGETTMALRIETRAHAAIAAAVVYPDGEVHDDMTTGNAEEDGTFEWTWLVKPEVPVGDAKVLLSAGDYEPHGEYEGSTNGETAEETFPFRVAESC